MGYHLQEMPSLAGYFYTQLRNIHSFENKYSKQQKPYTINLKLLKYLKATRQVQKN